MRNALLPLVRDETLDFSISENVVSEEEAGLQFKPLIQPSSLSSAGEDIHLPTLYHCSNCQRPTGWYQLARGKGVHRNANLGSTVCRRPLRSFTANRTQPP
jgi:hypothetical protein